MRFCFRAVLNVAHSSDDEQLTAALTSIAMRVRNNIPVRIVLVVNNLRTIYFLLNHAASASFQILACYLSNRTDPYASIVLVNCTVDRQVGFSLVVI